MSGAPAISPPQDPPRYVALVPMAGSIWSVRWLRPDRHEARHRYYRRRSDALAFAARMRARGRPVAVFVSAVDWEQVAA